MNATIKNIENPFEDPAIANEWIACTEQQQSRSREVEFYPLLERWVTRLNPGLIVEVGSGEGICSSKFGNRYGNYIGIEPSDPLRARAIEKYGNARTHFMKGIAHKMALPASCASAVFSIGVWFHVPDLDAAHSEVARILKKGGEFMIFSANSAARPIWDSWFRDPIQIGNRTEGAVAVPGGVLSRNIFIYHDEAELKASLESNSFRVQSMDPMGYGGGARKEPIWTVTRAVRI